MSSTRYDASSLLFLRTVLDGLLDQPEGKEVIKFISDRAALPEPAMPAMKAWQIPLTDREQHHSHQVDENGVGYGTASAA